MRLYEYVPVYDLIVDDESLIHRVFGMEFCVVDEADQLLTTTHNKNLLRRAQLLLTHAETLERDFLAQELRDLARRAETLSQWEYESAVRQDAGFEYTQYEGLTLLAETDTF